MKLFIKKNFTLIVLLLANITTIYAQNSWSMGILDEGQYQPEIKVYYGYPDTLDNGVEYLRIHDESSRINPNVYESIPLPYGYRLEDKRIYLYDYDKCEEYLAFDFSLTPGDTFCTFNGVEWIIKSVSDTLVNVSYQGLGEDTYKRLFSVQSKDGKYIDKWLEDFGSLTNHFMIFPLNEYQRYFTFWMEYDHGCYFCNEISSDPVFTHDFGTPNPEKEEGEFISIGSCSYLNRTVKVEYSITRSLWREYKIFYRKGNDFYYTYTWPLNPFFEICGTTKENGTFSFFNLPPAENGEYVIHFSKEDGTEDETTSIYKKNKTELDSLPRIYDLSARKQTLMNRDGIYIINGKKYLINK